MYVLYVCTYVCMYVCMYVLYVWCYVCVTTRLVSRNINWRQTTELYEKSIYFCNTKTQSKMVSAKHQNPIVCTPASNAWLACKPPSEGKPPGFYPHLPRCGQIGM